MTIKAVRISLCILLVWPVLLRAQAVIGGDTPDPSAVLDIQSNSQGMLLPRLSTAQRDAIPGPGTGLMIFNTTTFCVEMNAGTASAPEWVRMQCRTGTVTSLNCGSAVITGTLYAGYSAVGASASIPYSGGNGALHNGQVVTSTGVTGLTATLSAGTFANGDGTLTYSITGTPSSGNTASFAINIGGQSCTLNVSVTTCRARVNATDYKNFQCFNLGAANTNTDPFTPGWQINGGYWQWGRAAQAAPGPVGPEYDYSNSWYVDGWNTSSAQDSSWKDGTKTVNDPCPSGYRLPTKTEYEGLYTFNTMTVIGSDWNNAATNYNTGRKFGDYLMLPGAGYRTYDSGYLGARGVRGDYWCSTENSGTYDSYKLGWELIFDNNNIFINWGFRIYGFSVRCVEE